VPSSSSPSTNVFSSSGAVPSLDKYASPSQTNDLCSVKLAATDDGKVDLVALIKLWSMSMSLIAQLLAKSSKDSSSPVPPTLASISQAEPIIAIQLHMHQTHLLNIRNLNKQLSEEVPALEQSVALLRELMDQKKKTGKTSLSRLMTPLRTPSRTSR
jgi:hypothetical protein